MELLVSISQALIANGPYLIGVALPPFIEIFNKDLDPNDPKNNGKRFLIAVAVCAMVAIILNLDKVAIGSVSEVLTSFTLIFTESQLVFKTYFQNSFLRGKMLEQLNKTTPPSITPLDQPQG